MNFVEFIFRKLKDIEIEEIYSKGRRKVQVEARDLLCYWAVRELGISCTDLAKQLEIVINDNYFSLVTTIKIPVFIFL
jgi:hypothetical protein